MVNLGALGAFLSSERTIQQAARANFRLNVAFASRTIIEGVANGESRLTFVEQRWPRRTGPGAVKKRLGGVSDENWRIA